MVGWQDGADEDVASVTEASVLLEFRWVACRLLAFGAVSCRHRSLTCLGGRFLRGRKHR